MTIRRLSLAAGLVLAAVGCSNDDLITPPVPQYKGGPMFQRYVAMGNSITAGFQSGGINDSTQQQSYVALVAGKMGSPFYYPSLTKPGCPPPIDTVFTATGDPLRQRRRLDADHTRGDVAGNVQRNRRLGGGERRERHSDRSGKRYCDSLFLERGDILRVEEQGGPGC